MIRKKRRWDSPKLLSIRCAIKLKENRKPKILPQRFCAPQWVAWGSFDVGPSLKSAKNNEALRCTGCPIWFNSLFGWSVTLPITPDKSRWKSLLDSGCRALLIRRTSRTWWWGVGSAHSIPDQVITATEAGGRLPRGKSSQAWTLKWHGLGKSRTQAGGLMILIPRFRTSSLSWKWLPARQPCFGRCRALTLGCTQACHEIPGGMLK